MRTHGGNNDNPTARQFKGIFKRLLMRHQVKHNGGNCLALDSTSCLPIDEPDLMSMHQVRQYQLQNTECVENDHDYDALLMGEEILEYKVSNLLS